MDRFVKGKRKAIEVAQNQAGHSKSKCRKYDEAYLALGFTVNVVGEEERPMCVLCLKTLAADSMKPTKLRRHIETMHPNYFQKSLEFLKENHYSNRLLTKVPIALHNARNLTLLQKS